MELLYVGFWFYFYFLQHLLSGLLLEDTNLDDTLLVMDLWAILSKESPSEMCMMCTSNLQYSSFCSTNLLLRGRRTCECSHPSNYPTPEACSLLTAASALSVRLHLKATHHLQILHGLSVWTAQVLFWTH